MDELFRHQSYLPGRAGTGRLDAQTGADVLLETVEIPPHTEASFDQDGNQPGKSSHGKPESERLLAVEPKYSGEHCSQ